MKGIVYMLIHSSSFMSAEDYEEVMQDLCQTYGTEVIASICVNLTRRKEDL